MIAGSSLGTRVFRPSMMVPTPKEFHRDANSEPMTPPPSTMADFGGVVQLEASVEVMIFLEMGRPMVLATEPEASTMFSAL
ncbi:hypothetical protein GY12_20530 [Micrococcus luteus]|nr:hypothetical protein GY12_20530 [Micrococcus luteus]